MQKQIRKLISFGLILLIIPLTILAGVYFFADRKYYLISLTVIVLTLLPFFLRFEHRRPKAREIMVIAVMTALAVAGRTAFFMLPQVKPMAAVIIITGVCFGAQAGFLTGAMAVFVSNFFFGQGPWTPWQMFAFGIIGFLSGILFCRGRLRPNRLPLSIFGGLAVFILYGGIVNLGSLMMKTPVFSAAALIATYATGAWFDFAHAISTVLFLFFLARPMLDKLERIRTKYGIL